MSQVLFRAHDRYQSIGPTSKRYQKETSRVKCHQPYRLKKSSGPLPGRWDWFRNVQAMSLSLSQGHPTLDSSHQWSIHPTSGASYFSSLEPLVEEESFPLRLLPFFERRPEACFDRFGFRLAIREPASESESDSLVVYRVPLRLWSIFFRSDVNMACTSSTLPSRASKRLSTDPMFPLTSSMLLRISGSSLLIASPSVSDPENTTRGGFKCFPYR